MANLFKNIGNWVSDRLGLNPPKLTMPTVDATKAQTNADIAKWAQGAFQQWRDSGVTNPGSATFQPMSRGYSTVNGFSGYDPGRMGLAYTAATTGMDAAKAAEVNKLRDFYAGRNMLRSTAGMKAEGDIGAKYDTEKARIRSQLELADIAEGERQRQADITRKQDFDSQQYGRFFDILNAARTAAGGSPYTPESMLAYENSLAKRNSWTSPIGAISDLAGTLGGLGIFGGKRTPKK